MTRSKLKIAISGLIASTLVLALFCFYGIMTTSKTPASAETIVVNGETTAFLRPSTITVDVDKHTLNGEEKSALKVHCGSITHGGEELKMLVGSTFANLKLQIKWPGAEDEYPRTDGEVRYIDSPDIIFSDFSASPGLDKTDNVSYIDLVSVSDGYDLYFCPDSTFLLYSSNHIDGELLYHTDLDKPWYLTLTAAYSVNGEATENPAMVTLSRIVFTPNLLLASFEVSENERYYNSGYEAGHTAGKAEGYESGFTEGKAEGLTEGKAEGLAEGKSKGYDEGYDAGYAAGKAAAAADNDNPASGDNNKPSGDTDKPATDNKTDDKTDSTFVAWIKTNKTVLIVSGVLVVGLIILLCLVNTKRPRRRR